MHDWEGLIYPKVMQLRAETTPDGAYLQHVDGPSRTYGESHESNLRWADGFRRLGVEAGDRVLTMLPNCFEHFDSWMGAAWLKALESAVNTDYRGALLRERIADLEPKIIVLSSQYLDRLFDARDVLAGVRALVVMDAGKQSFDDHWFGIRALSLEEFLADAVPATELPCPEPWDLAGINYTSGTTGPSKGALTYWRFRAYGMRVSLPPCDVSEEDAAYVPYPCFHNSGRSHAESIATYGGRNVMRASLKVDEFWEDIATFKCTTVTLLGPVANFLFRQQPRPDDAATPLKYVFMVPLIPEFEEFQHRFDVRLWTAFASTEMNIPISTGFVERGADFRSVGKLRSEFEARLVDEHDQEVPFGTVGELIVRSHQPFMLTKGYWGRPEASLEAFRNGWFHTGDALKREEDGSFYFVDRMKDTLRRRGENISSIEAEACITEHPAVLEAAVVGVPSEWGEQEVKAVIVCKPGEEVAPEALISFLVTRMPRFMIPRFIEIVDELPRTPTNRVRKADLRDAGVTERTWDRERAGIRLPR